MTSSELNELGRLLARGGPRWFRYLEAARDLWAGKGKWSHEHAARIASALFIGPAPMRCSRECPRCPNPPLGQWNGRRTVLTLPDRDVSKCARCGVEWVSRVDRKWLRPRSELDADRSAAGAAGICPQAS